MPRPTDWVDTVLSLSVTSGGQANVSLITGLAPADMRGATLIRTMIRMSMSSTTIAGAWGTTQMNMGIGITDQEAFAAGVLPDPNVSGDKPARGWVWRSAMGISQDNNGSGAIIFDERADVRGSRKIENGELYLIVHGEPITGTTFTTKVTGLIRILIKLA